jgi:hypothetical protein
MGLFAIGTLLTLTPICIGENKRCIRTFCWNFADAHDHRIAPFLRRMCIWRVLFLCPAIANTPITVVESPSERWSSLSTWEVWSTSRKHKQKRHSKDWQCKRCFCYVERLHFQTSLQHVPWGQRFASLTPNVLAFFTEAKHSGQHKPARVTFTTSDGLTKYGMKTCGSWADFA